MTRFFGKVGYSEGTTETAPGVYTETIVEFEYFGNVVRDTRRLTAEEKVNFDISVDNSISIVADAYAGEHFHAMRYVEWAGTLWIVETVEVRSPRLLLRLGGVYNGPRATP